jgi:hypothetical protein
VLTTQPAAALNVPVASRVIAFVQPPLSGTINAVIIYDPSSAASEAEATSIEQQFGNGLVVGRGIIRVRRVPVDALPNLTNARLAFVTAGIRSQALSEFAAREGVLTISSDTSCVQAARCVMSISDQSRTQITVSRAAAQSARVHFTSAFLMLVRER